MPPGLVSNPPHFYSLLSCCYLDPTLFYTKSLKDPNYAKHLVKVKVTENCVSLGFLFSVVQSITPYHQTTQMSSWRPISKSVKGWFFFSAVRIVLRKLLIVHLDSGTCAGFRQSRTGGRQNQGRFFSFLPWISNCGNHLTPVCTIVTIIHILCLPLESTQSPLDDISPNLINLMLQDKNFWFSRGIASFSWSI